MAGLFRLRDFIARHAYVSLGRLHRIDKKVEDRVCERKPGSVEKIRKIYRPAEFLCSKENTVGEKKYNLQIIIPMYNAQKYIVRCLDSIFSQKTDYTYKVIVIDDGSTDSASKIIKEKYTDKNLQVIMQRNKGTASARNEGLAVIEADYVMFVDADDMLKSSAIDVLLKKAYEENACAVEGGYELFSRGFSFQICHLDREVPELCGNLWGFAWAKVFKAELLKDICFPQGYWYEDTIVAYILYPRCIKAYTIKDVVYRYRRNPKGFSRIRGNDVKLLDSFWVLYYTIKEMQARGIVITQGKYEAILRSMITCCKRVMFMNDDIRKEVLCVFSEMIDTDFATFKCEDPDLAIFEKIVRNNDYYKFRRILVCLRE